MHRPLPSSRGYKIVRRLSNFCVKYESLYSIAKLIWKYMIWCNHCGKDVGFMSVVSKFGFNCWKCHDIELFKEKICDE